MVSCCLRERSWYIYIRIPPTGRRYSGIYVRIIRATFRGPRLRERESVTEKAHHTWIMQRNSTVSIVVEEDAISCSTGMHYSALLFDSLYWRQ
jgi:hypothetical protein